jgi:hypothetical protein
MKSAGSNVRTSGLTWEIYMERDTLENGVIGGSILLLVLGTRYFNLSGFVIPGSLYSTWPDQPVLL